MRRDGVAGTQEQGAFIRQMHREGRCEHQRLSDHEPESPLEKGESPVLGLGRSVKMPLYAFAFGAYGAHLLGAPNSTLLRAGLSASVLLLFLGVNLIGTAAMGCIEDLIVLVKVVFLGLLAVAGFTSFDAQKPRPLFDHGVPAVSSVVR